MVAKYFFDLIVQSLKDQRQDDDEIKSSESLTLVLREMGSLVLTMWQERYDYLARYVSLLQMQQQLHSETFS